MDDAFPFISPSTCIVIHTFLPPMSFYSFRRVSCTVEFSVFIFGPVFHGRLYDAGISIQLLVMILFKIINQVLLAGLITHEGNRPRHSSVVIHSPKLYYVIYFIDDSVIVFFLFFLIIIHCV